MRVSLFDLETWSLMRALDYSLTANPIVCMQASAGRYSISDVYVEDISETDGSFVLLPPRASGIINVSSVETSSPYAV